MKKKIFAVSDIHGEYEILIKGLKEAGFDEDNPNHLLVSIGDALDRGDECLEVYKYLKRLSDEGKAIVLKGNHTGFFTNYLDGTSLDPFNYFHNGTRETMADFLHQTAPFESWCVLDKDIDVPTTEEETETKDYTIISSHNRAKKFSKREKEMILRYLSAHTIIDTAKYFAPIYNIDLKKMYTRICNIKYKNKI